MRDELGKSGARGYSARGRSGGSLPQPLRSGIEALSGLDMSGVRVHHNSNTPAQLNALAYAQGSDIHLGPGQEHHLPHEAWHVVQQRQGRVQPTTQIAGASVNDDGALEREADLMWTQAASGAVEPAAQVATANGAPSGGPASIQLKRNTQPVSTGKFKAAWNFAADVSRDTGTVTHYYDKAIEAGVGLNNSEILWQARLLAWRRVEWGRFSTH